MDGKESVNGFYDLKIGAQKQDKKRIQQRINLSLSQSIIPTNFAKYPRVTVGADLKSPEVSKEKAQQELIDEKEPAKSVTPRIRETEPGKVSVDAKKEPIDSFTPKIPELEPDQLADLLKHFTPNELMSLQKSITKALNQRKCELIAAKHKQIEKLEWELEELNRKF